MFLPWLILPFRYVLLPLGSRIVPVFSQGWISERIVAANLSFHTRTRVDGASRPPLSYLGSDKKCLLRKVFFSAGRFSSRPSRLQEFVVIAPSPRPKRAKEIYLLAFLPRDSSSAPSSRGKEISSSRSSSSCPPPSPGRRMSGRSTSCAWRGLTR